jgi:opine dehydrogenase
MILHTPGAVLGASWVEATGGDFTFYVQGMTPGVARVMAALDGERRAVAESFGHQLPSVTQEMQSIGTVEASCSNLEDFAFAIASGAANRQIKAPDSLKHRYYLEDFGHGLLPFVELANIAGTPVPVAASLLLIAETLLGRDLRAVGRTAERMGVAGMDRDRLQKFVGAKSNGQ